MKEVITITHEHYHERVEEKLNLYRLNSYLNNPKQRRTKCIYIIADDNHLE